MSISSILSRPLNMQGCFLGSEMNMLRLFQEGRTGDLEHLLKLGLNPNSLFTHPQYKNFSFLSFVVLSTDLVMEKKLELVELLLKYGASEISLEAVNLLMFRLSSYQLELVAQLLFLLPKSLWKNAIDLCRDKTLKKQLNVVLGFEGLFEVLQKKHFCVFRAALKVSCLKKLDVFSLKSFDINNNVEGKDHTLLHFSSYHLSLASSKKHATKLELEKVVLSLLSLGADSLKLTGEDHTEVSTLSSSSRKRKVSSLLLINMGCEQESTGELSSVVQEAIWKNSISNLLQKHPVYRESRTACSLEEASKIAQVAAPRFITKSSSEAFKKSKK